MGMGTKVSVGRRSPTGDQKFVVTVPVSCQTRSGRRAERASHILDLPPIPLAPFTFEGTTEDENGYSSR
jgi:hypothetical protein